MVGVAGGSHGCANCKRRRVKVCLPDIARDLTNQCDETLPACLRCLKRNLNCGGPVVGLIFKNQQSADRMTTLAMRHGLGVAGETYIVNMLHQQRARTPVLYESAIQRQLRSFASSMPRELSFMPEFDMYLHCVKIFLNHFALMGPKLHTDEMPNHWVGSLPRFVLSSAPSSTSFAARALVISHSSLLSRDSDVKLLGAHWYVEALRHQKTLVGQLMSRRELYEVDDGCPELSDRVYSPTANVPKPSRNSVLLPENSVRTADRTDLSPEDDALIASMLLVTYEILHGMQGLAWISLVDGAVQLLQSRGPETYKSGFHNTLFLTMRSTISLAAVVRQQKSFLRSKEWMTIPWQNHHKGKTLLHLFIDVVLEMAEYEEVAAKYLTGPELSPISGLPRLRREFYTREVYHELRQTYQKLIVLDEKFDSLFKKYKRAVRDQVADDPLYDTVAEFDDDTGAPVRPVVPCPAAESFEHWKATHFFKPAVEYTSLHDSRLLVKYLVMRMILIHLLLLTFPFQCTEFEEYWLEKPEIEAHMHERLGKLEKYSRLLCRSLQFLRNRALEVSVLSPMFPLRIDHLVLSDSLERGWIAHQLHGILPDGVDLNLGMFNKVRDLDHDRNLFEALDLCPGCGERVRATASA